MLKHTLKKKRPTKGFTLVEVTISLALATIAFVGVCATYSTSLAIQRDIDDRAKVLYEVQRTLEETANQDYEDLEAGTTIDYIMDEGEGYDYLMIETKIENIADEQIEDLWTRFADPDPDVAYKLITVKCEWGDYMLPPETWEQVKMSWYRVKRENSVEFHERASSQLPVVN